MNYVKGALQSTTVWMGVIGIGAAVAGSFGYTVTDADQTAIVQGISHAVEGIAAVGAIIFRIRATHMIKLGGK